MKSLLNFLLLAISLVLFSVFFLIGMAFTIGYSIRLRSFRKMVGYWSNSALSMALVIDLLGNVVCRDFLNWAMIKGADCYEFGNYKETISSVLGKNKALGTLTDAGRGLANFLNWLQPNHVELAAGTILKIDE
ncbi:hypothetical protein [Spirosoma litoris]